MPPRYAYWTILVDNQPTAFRAADQEDLAPTFKRLKQKHPSAEMKWFQNGKLWDSRLDAQEAMRARGERGRAGDARQGGLPAEARRATGGFRDRKFARDDRDSRRGDDRPAFRERGSKPQNPRTSERGNFRTSRPQDFKPSPERGDDGQLLWKPKGEFTPAPKRSEGFARSQDLKSSRPSRDRKPEWKPRGEGFSRPQDLKSSRPPRGKAEWKPRERDSKPLEWKPKGEAPASGPSTRDGFRKPKPAARSGSGRDKNWRPGGDHKDPRQKYKDAKKAKWQRFKKAIRTRWEAKQDGPRKKRRDEES